VIVAAIDPGRTKCGLAVCAPGRVLHREIVETPALAARVRDLVAGYAPDVVLMGRRSVAAALKSTLAQLGIAVTLVDESHTTLLARTRYWKDHKPRGWRRLLPAGLRLPVGAYDDYVAVLLAEQFLGEQGASGAAEENHR
jgi:RNase H-fold protein (predicted Holliday junction resolvase)